MSSQYEERLSRVIAYIHEHLDEDLDLNRVAEVACLSPFHWHRIYHAVHGETAAATVKRLRLHRAAGQLAHTSMPVRTIAARSGYTSLESFTRIFKASFGMPPAQYRRQGSHTKFDPGRSTGGSEMYNVTIDERPAMQAVTVAHIGSYMEIGKAFDQLFGMLGSRRLIGPGMRMVAIFYDDPSAVPEAQLRSRAGAVLGRSDGSLETTEIEGGPYAVLRHKGPYADMKAAYQWLYGTWLVNSGREAGDAPVFEEYLNNPRDTPPAELLTDICLPLR